jgi:hypothetical protein
VTVSLVSVHKALVSIASIKEKIGFKIIEEAGRRGDGPNK